MTVPGARRDAPLASRLEQGVLVTIVMLLPIRALSPVFASIVSPGVLLALPVIFVAVTRLGRYRFGGTAGLVFGLVLATAPLLWLDTDGRAVAQDSALAAMLTIAVAFAHLAMLLWAREKIGLHATVALYAIGMICQVALTPEHTAGNPWKFGLAVPVTLLALSIASRARPFWTVLVFATAIFVSVQNDFRSFVGLPLVAVIMWVWNRRSSIPVRWKLMGFVSISLIAYFGGTQAALAGWLGERNRLVTEKQIMEAGSVLAGGRVESAASFALFQERPVGFGPGVLPTSVDITTGQAALFQRGVAIDGEYVTDYLFGAGVKLHSIAADLWITYGLAGLSLAAVMLTVAVFALIRGFSERTTPALVFFASVVTLWNLAFSPIGTNLWETILLIAVMMATRGAHHSHSKAITFPPRQGATAVAQPNESSSLPFGFPRRAVASRLSERS